MHIKNTASYSALQGIQRGMQRLNIAANEIARANTSNQNADVADISKALVEVKQAGTDIQASQFTIKVEDQMLGSLLDMRV